MDRCGRADSEAGRRLGRAALAVLCLTLLTGTAWAGPAPSRQSDPTSPGSSTGPQPPCADCTPLQVAALAAAETGDTSQAETLLKQALDESPGWAAGWWRLGSLYYEGGRFGACRNAFRAFSDLEPKTGSGWGMLGICEFNQKSYKPALDDLDRSLTLGLGGNEELRFAVSYHAALLLSRFQQYEESFSILVGLCLNYADNPKVIQALGLAALRLPFLPEETPADRREAVELAGQATALAASNHYPEARSCYDTLGKRFGDLPNVHFARALFFLMEDPDAALGEFLEELRVSPRHLEARIQIALEYVKRGAPQSAIPYAQEAVALEPRSFAARYALGAAWLDSGRLKDAQLALEQARALNSVNPQVHFLLARAYAKAGQAEAARRAREEFLRLDRQAAHPK